LIGLMDAVLAHVVQAHVPLHIDRACTRDNKKYSIKVYAHMDRGVIEAIKSAALPTVRDYEDGREAIASYMGTIIDSYNDYLRKFKVEVELDLNAFDATEFLVTKGFDNSCERTDPVIVRTEVAHKYFMDTYKDKIGVHLFLWSCPFRDDRMREMLVVGEPDACARSIGVLWAGTDGTVDFIKSTITEAISGARNLFLNGTSPNDDEEVGIAYICQYADRCVVSVPSANGMIVFGNDEFRNTIPGPEGHESSLVYIPPEEGAAGSQRVTYVDEPSDVNDSDCKY